MTDMWTSEDIEAIMMQLNNQSLPFKRYEFSDLGNGMTLLGSGASSNVYEATARGNRKKTFAIKVIGFGNKHVETASFQSSVKAQADFGNIDNNVVKIYDSVELRVWIEGEHDVTRSEIIEQYEKYKPEGNFLHLQFILMEKVTPVLWSNRFEHKITPYKLASYDESEVMKLAYEIGLAINNAHKNKLIHRDIKLENIFYDTKGQCYKLGDFGIARITDDGMASTVAFTKGYGAPEVIGTMDDKYDYTADIYSFGVLLYLLLNEMKFPGSTDYRPSVYQYVQGYVPPEPVNGSDELVQIVLRMMSFDPDDRYQSMEEVLNEFDELKFGHRFKYQREHSNIALALGTVFALMGAVMWELSFMQGVNLEFDIWIYILCGLGICQSILYISRNTVGFINAITFCVGIYLIITSGFSILKLIVLIVMVFGYYWSGVIGGCALAANITYLITNKNYAVINEFTNYRWFTMLLISLAVILLVLHWLLGERDEKIIKSYFSRNMYWFLAFLYYISLIVASITINMKNDMGYSAYEKILGVDKIKWFMSWNPGLVGIIGACFCVVWVLREYILIFIEKCRNK